MSLFRRIADGLKKTREVVAVGIDRVVRERPRVDPALFDELEEVLLRGDVGLDTTEELLDRLRKRVREGKIESSAAVPELLREIAADILAGARGGAQVAPPSPPEVVLVCGVNGAGKTTTIGKLARLSVAEGKRTIVVAADTFRAAAVEQLIVWAQRGGAEVVRSTPGADPAAVAYDGVRAAIARRADRVIVDTADRLQSKGNLMEELRKIHRVIGKALPGAPHEVFLVLDATIGQNGLLQAREFLEAAGVTGLIVAKLDSSSKGGVVLAIARETGLPVRYVGTGEGIDDLDRFDPDLFAAALIDAAPS